MALAKHHICGDVCFRFYGDLHHFLPKRTNGLINYSITYTVTIKDAIEAIGVPHVEIGNMTKNTQSLPFSYFLQPNDTIEVYPLSSVLENDLLRPQLPKPLRFILDVHLGSLARLLRLTGFDTLYETNAHDADIALRSANENRIVLTRDIGLLKHKIINWGYWIRSQQTDVQFNEVANRFDLWSSFAPFMHCLACNGKIKPVDKESALSTIPPNAALYFDSFYQCGSCQRIYWKGSHYDKMLQTLERIRKLKAA